VHKDSRDAIRSALPATFRGKKIEVLETARRDSIIDPEWYAKNAEHFYTGKPVVMVTGTTAGIGLEMVKQLVRQGYRVVATGHAQSLARLTEAGLVDGENLMIRAMDVVDSAAQEKVISEVAERWGGVDVLVNNAAITYRAAMEHVTADELRHIMDVNFVGPHELTPRVLPLLRMKGRGKIVYNSSVMGTIGVPTLGPYVASKHAIEGAAESLYHEVRGFGVDVTLVEPGYVNSGAADKILRTPRAQAAIANPNDPYHKAYKAMEDVTQMGMNATMANSENVARDIIGVIGQTQPPLRVRNTIDSKAFYWFKLLPEDVQKTLMRAGYVDPDQWARLGVGPGH
jgi:NAD(P)-dependent dehydrogenase (short-subunit alcohol dehydrogenase family)